MPEFNWPDASERVLILGRTGSGKTVAALYELSRRDWDTRPWVIFDTKGDENIEKISKFKGTKTIGLNDTPGKSGLYIVRPLPNQTEHLNSFLWRIWARGNCGLYFDEGYMIGDSEAYNAILTQGRSKKIPVLTLSQRPAWLSRFCFTESSFLWVFSLTDKEDRKRVQTFLPREQVDIEERLPPYHSLWYDIGQDKIFRFAPVPPVETILATFRERLQPRRVAI